MTHPYKPTIFALNTHKLDVLPDHKDRARSIEVGRRGHLAGLVRDRAADALSACSAQLRWPDARLNRRTFSGQVLRVLDSVLASVISCPLRVLAALNRLQLVDGRDAWPAC
jgi:hypothetical protein